MYTKILLSQCLCLLASLALSSQSTVSATTFTWTGATGSEAMDSDLNWQGGSAPVSNGTANELHFGVPQDGIIEAGHYLVMQSFSGSYMNVASIVFANDTLAYKLHGSPLRIHANHTYIHNQSAYQQWIDNDIIVASGSAAIWSSAGLVIDTGRSGIRWSGTSDRGIGQRTIWKTGTGNLHITNIHHVNGNGANTDWRILSGTLTLDMNAGGNFTRDNPALATRIILGANVGATLANTAHFRLIGIHNEDTTSGLLNLFGGEGDAYARRTITVDSNGGSLQLKASYFTDATGSSLHLNLSPNASITTTGSTPSFSGHTAGAAGLYYAVTINDGAGLGFATYVDNSGTKSYTRYTGAFTELTGNAIGNNTNYYLEEGKTTTHTTTKNTFLFGATLTIRNTDGSGGSFVNNAGSGGMHFYGLLMEAGVGDYVFNPLYGNSIAGSNNSGVVVHQYSIAGDLIFANGIQMATNKAFIKTGPGTVILRGTSPNTEAIYVQQGLLKVEGSMLNSSKPIIVYDTASFGGFGQVKTTQNVIVMDGGILVGTNHTEKGLSLEVGTGLDMRTGSNYLVEIGENRLDPLNVTGNVSFAGNLELVLDYAPSLHETITLLTYTGSRTGKFITINNKHFDGVNGDEFLLEYESRHYLFQILYHTASLDIQVVAIPESTTVAVWIGVAGLGWLLYRRRRNSHLRHSTI